MYYLTWEVPKVREFLQTRLTGCSWFCTFDFVTMFWQIGLHKNESHRLFSFFAGRHDSFCFNRGPLNSSVYTQKMLTRMLAGQRTPDFG